MNSKVCSAKGCDVLLVDGVNHTASNNNNKCHTCYSKVMAPHNKKNNGERKYLNGSHVKVSDPSHKLLEAGRNFTDGRKASGKSTKKEGFVYIITNPAWPQWVKVGLTTEEDTRKRLSSYQTGSPLRDYVVYDEWPVDVARDSEKVAHNLLKDHGIEKRNEWFQCSPAAAELMIRGELEDANTREITTPPRPIGQSGRSNNPATDTEWVAARPEADLFATSHITGEEV
jgi:hypothetical protein